MQDATNLRSINMGQLVTATDRLLAFGRPRKFVVERDRPQLVSPATERTVIVRPRRAPFGFALVFAALMGVASVIAIGVGATHASTLPPIHQP